MPRSRRAPPSPSPHPPFQPGRETRQQLPTRIQAFDLSSRLETSFVKQGLRATRFGFSLGGRVRFSLSRATLLRGNSAGTLRIRDMRAAALLPGIQSARSSKHFVPD